MTTYDEDNMINWIKTSDESIKSDCGAVSVARFCVQGQTKFMVFEHILKESKLRGLFDTAEQAKAHAQGFAK